MKKIIKHNKVASISKNKKHDIIGQKYQGKEFTVLLQAPTEQKLEQMINGLKKFAYRFEMEDIKVLSKRKDPDGGWEATIKAHNWNPIQWVKDKYADYKLTKEAKRGLELYRESKRLDSENALLKKQVENTRQKQFLDNVEYARQKREKLEHDKRMKNLKKHVKKNFKQFKEPKVIGKVINQFKIRTSPRQLFGVK